MFKLQWFSSQMNMWYHNKFKSRKEMQKRINYFQERNIKYKITEEIEEIRK